MPVDRPEKVRLTADQGWNRLMRTLAYSMPATLHRSGQARAALRTLRTRGAR